MQKPSAKNIILIASAAAIIGVALIVSRHENPVYFASAQSTQNSMQLGIITGSGTSTNDTLSYGGNWEKTLSTAVAGTWGSSSSSEKTASSTSLTPTDLFGEDLFARYAQAQNSGQDLTDPNVQQAVVAEVMSDGTVLSTPKLYTMSDIKIIQDNSSTSIKTYGNAVGLVYVENYFKHEGELDIVQGSLDDNNPAELKQLDPIIAEYQAMLQGEITVTTPSTLANTQLTLVNALTELIFADQSFEKTYSDGLTSLGGLNIYKQGAADLDTSFTGIETALNIDNITYTTQEPGIIFTYKPQ